MEKVLRRAVVASCVLAISACAAATVPLDSDTVLLEQANVGTRDWVAGGNALRNVLENRLDGLRRDLGEAQRTLKITGAVQTAVGAAGATAIAAVGSTADAKKWIGVSTSGVAIVIGLIQTIRGAGTSVESFVTEADDLITAWDIADTSTSALAKEAYLALRTGANALRQRYPEIQFVIPPVPTSE